MGKRFSNPAGLCVMVLSENPEATLTRIRLLIPLNKWAEQTGGRIFFRSFEDFELTDAKSADIYIVQRASSAYSLVIVRYLQSIGRPVVYDIDDLITEIPDFLGHHGGLIKKRGQIAKIIRHVDYVTCTQSILATKMAEINRNVWICPNYGDPNFDPVGPVSSIRGEQATLVVATTDSVLVDFVLGAIKRVLLKYGKSVRLVVIGPIGAAFRAAQIEADYFPIVEHRGFTNFVAALCNPIGLIPLDDSLFSSCKSAVKYFDYSVAGLATICSDVAPYNSVVSDGVDGYLVSNTEAGWYGAMDRLVSDCGLRERIAHAARENVSAEHSVNVAVDAWARLLAKINDRVYIAPMCPSIGVLWLQFLFFPLRWNRRRIVRRRGI